jgi:transcription-repair coupling factor (superfamily II helicase)
MGGTGAAGGAGADGASGVDGASGEDGASGVDGASYGGIADGNADWDSGELYEEEFVPTIDVSVPALLPDDYVPDRQTKANLYQRILAIDSEDEAASMWEELKDRFGTPPVAAENLFRVVRIKLLMKKLKVDQVVQTRDVFSIRFFADPGFSGEEFLKLMAEFPYKISIAAADSSSLELKIRTTEKNFLPNLHEFLIRICEINK